MGEKFSRWEARTSDLPSNYDELRQLIEANRAFEPVADLAYGDYGLEATIDIVGDVIRDGGRIALYADYDVDGTMSAVSWIWFLEALGYSNFLHYIPCRFREGYGVNLDAVKHLIDNEKADLIITMDTGITANNEAAYCRERGVKFICTDHHKIQPEKMPDCTILNPKQHPDEMYQELCGCGITFVLLRRLSKEFPIPAATWTDLLALVGMATICDVVPLNGVNHRLAKMGVDALMRSRREVLVKLRQACAMFGKGDEKDVGFRVGPRINAVGRLYHADKVVEAFVGKGSDELIEYMETCNDERKQIQLRIVEEADQLAQQHVDDPILFLGGDWHPGVVGIAASKIAERYWKPTWLFNRDEGMCKGSARSIPGFDVTDAMSSAKDLFVKFGGHKAAGGFSFELEDEATIRAALIEFAGELRSQQPQMWESKREYDCELPLRLLNLSLADSLSEMKPFGHGFEEPSFRIKGAVSDIKIYNDKTTGEPRHTALFIANQGQRDVKVMFFQEVMDHVAPGQDIECLIMASRDSFRGRAQLSVFGIDYQVG